MGWLELLIPKRPGLWHEDGGSEAGKRSVITFDDKITRSLNTTLAWLVALVRLVCVVDALLHLLQRRLQHAGEVSRHRVDALLQPQDVIIEFCDHGVLGLCQLVDLFLQLLLLRLLLLDVCLCFLNLLVVRRLHLLVDLSHFCDHLVGLLRLVLHLNKELLVARVEIRHFRNSILASLLL